MINCRFLLALAAYGFIYGCNSGKSLSLSEYLKQVHDREQNLTAVDSFNNFKISLEYLPPIIMAFREAGTIEELRSNHKTLLSDYSDASYFELKFHKKDESTRKFLKSLYHDSDTSQSALEQYFDFGIQNDIDLIVHADTIPCSYLHREISEGITNEFTYTLSFDSKHNYVNTAEVDQVIILNLRKTELPPIRLIIPATHIDSIPSLKIIDYDKT